MRIGVHTWGSEGDVRPFAALCHGLAQRGHEVTLAYTSVDRRDYSALAKGGGFRAQAVGAEYFEGARASIEAQMRELAELRNPLKQLRKVVELTMLPVMDEMYETSRALCATTDLQIAHFIHHPAATAALAAGQPLAAVLTAPAIPSRHYAPIGAPDLGSFAIPLWWRFMRTAADSIFIESINQVRGKAGLPALKSLFTDGLALAGLSLTAVSPTLFPKPADWDARHEVCGFFNVPDGVESWQPGPALEAFLAAGPRPVFFTFGSIVTVDPEQGLESVRMMREAAKLAGVRAIIQAPAALLAEVPVSDTLLGIDHAPHGRIFPRCAAVVHHGGAGTTQSATVAGCPSVVVAHGVDQFFWGRLLRRQGLGPKLLHRRGATAAKLAQRIREVLAQPSMKARAEVVGAAMRAEGGVARAASLIEQRLVARG